MSASVIRLTKTVTPKSSIRRSFTSLSKTVSHLSTGSGHPEQKFSVRYLIGLSEIFPLNPGPCLVKAVCSWDSHVKKHSLACYRDRTLFHIHHIFDCWSLVYFSAGQTSCRLPTCCPWTRRDSNPSPQCFQSTFIHVRSQCFKSLGRHRGRLGPPPLHLDVNLTG